VDAAHAGSSAAAAGGRGQASFSLLCLAVLARLEIDNCTRRGVSTGSY